ncbi:MAG TPA: TonB-dependent receptor [Gemmatimonadales bacterium]|nr:TonB-dependent receptor [Gemmatimonadales bacterium]
MYALLIAVALATAAPASAVVATEPTGPTLTGHVTTASGQPLPDVRVTIAEANRATTTSPEGLYKLVNLPTGTYSVQFALVGYAPVVRRVTLRADDVTLDVVLQPSAVELAEVQVTATPLATTPLTSPQPTSVLSSADLRIAQKPSLGETLDGMPGVHNLSTGPGVGKPVIRGLTSNRVLVLDDGQRMEAQQWGDEHAPNVETATAERIEVIRGPASVLYGSDALGGVINVVQRELPEARDRHPFVSGSVSAAYNGNGRAPDGSALVEGANGGWGFRLGLSGRTSENLRTPGYELWNSQNRAAGGTGSVGYHGDWGSLVATYSQRNEQLGLTDDDPTATPTQRIGTNRARIDLTLPMGQSRLETMVGFERNRRREFADDTTSAVGLGLLSKNYLANVKFHHAPLGPFVGVVGVSGWHTTFDKFGQEALIPNNRANNVGAYAFEQTEMGRWNLSFGARYDYRHLDADQDAELGVAAQTRTWNSLIGNVGVLYHVAEPVALVLNVGRGFRAPSAFDLYSNGVHEGTVAFERGNPNLTTEKSLNTDLAVRIQSHTVSLEVGAFANFIQDFIYTVPVPGLIDPASGYQVYDVTQGDARLTGFEGAFEYHPTSFLHLRAGADYVRGQNTTTNQPLPNMPPFRANYSVRLEGGSLGALNDTYLTIGGESNARQTRLDPDEAKYFAEAFDGAGFQPMGYSLVNVGAGFAFPAGRTNLRLDFQVRNLFNKAYADELSRIKTIAPLPGMGRAVMARFTTEF